jgi:hypothetical protein
MIVPIALAVAYALGVDLPRLAILAAAVYLPVVVSALILLVWWRGRVDPGDRPVLFCEGVASELRAGASLRAALAAAMGSVGGDAPEVTAPLRVIATEVSGQFPEIGEELRLTILNAGRSGSDSAALFDEIGSLALAKTEVRREIRAAAAPGRATALLFVGAPVTYVIGRAGSGDLERMLASPQQRFVALLGLGVFLVGLGATLVVLWRSGR